METRLKVDQVRDIEYRLESFGGQAGDEQKSSSEDFMIDLTCSQRTVSLTRFMASSLFFDHCALQFDFGIRAGTREAAFIVGWGTGSKKGRAGLRFYLVFEPRRINHIPSLSLGTLWGL